MRYEFELIGMLKVETQSYFKIDAMNVATRSRVSFLSLGCI